MDRLITARCFRVSRPMNAGMDFPDLLLQAMASTPGDREVEVDSGVTLRLERCTAMGPFLAGEFCRKQTENVPPFANEVGLAAIELPDGHGLGHMAAFLYHRATRVLALQSNRQSATPGRIASYFMRRNTESVFLLEAVLREDAYERILGRSIKKLHLRFASPENLEILEREGISAGKAAREMAEAYNAESIEITITAQRSDRSAHLDSGVSGLITRLMQGDVHVDTLDVKALTDEGIEPVNLLQEQIRFVAELDLPEANPDAHFRVRTSWLEEEFRAKLPALEAQFALRIDGN